MFTGIITAVGQIESVAPLGDHHANTQSHGVRLHIHAGNLDLSDVIIGDSIAIQGACMTVVALTQTHFDVEVSQESLRLTHGLGKPGAVNLEKALRLADRLDGHLVSGHVDGLGTVTNFVQVGESFKLCILAPTSLASYLAYKGSITVNGVSLTVNEVHDMASGCEFSINLIAHTLAHTTLKHLQINEPVNLEVDLIARYCARMLNLQKTL